MFNFELDQSGLLCQFSTSYFDGGKGTCTIVSSVLSLSFFVFVFLKFGNIASLLSLCCFSMSIAWDFVLLYLS